MKFRYIENCSAGFVELFGMVFESGKVVEVTDEHAIKKLENNSHFEKVKERKPRQVENGNIDGIESEGCL